MIAEAVAAIRAGEPVVVPTDTVYGLAASPHDEEAVRRMYRLKGRDDVQPTAIVAASREALLEAVPELAGERALGLLPGPFTLVLPNPARRFPWLNGTTPEAIGVRIPAVEGPGREVLQAVGVLVATSANLPGGPDPRRLEDVPDGIRAGCAALVDGGELPGISSTVVDLTGPEPAVLREGAVAAAEALRRLDSIRR